MPSNQSSLRSFSELGDAVGQARAKHGLIDRKLDEVSVTRRRSDREHDDRPFTATPTGRALFARYDILQKLAAYIGSPEAPKPPRAISRLVRLVDSETLALVAVDALINTIVAGWDWEDESAAMKVALAVGKDLRDEIEMARLRDPDRVDYRRVMEAKNHHAALWRYHTLEWSNRLSVRACWWLLNCAEACDLFESEQRRIGRNIVTLPKFADGHWEEIKKLREELSLARPYYLPHRKAPPDWTSWRTEYGPDRMPATFVRDEHPHTVAAIKEAFESGQLDRHAKGVSNVQRVPWKINEFMVPVVEKLAEHVEKRFKTLAGHDAEVFKTSLRDDIALARKLIGEPFWIPYNIDFRGRLNALPHFLIGREDRVRCLFQFWNGQPIGNSGYWLEIVVANAAGRKGTWRERHDWVAVPDNRDLIRRVAADPFETVEHWKDFSDPFQFVAACRELVAAENDPNFVTRLPVFLDGTSNGIQHLGCMTRDEHSGKLVNLMDLDERYDIYGLMRARVKTKMLAAGDKHAEWWLSPRGNCERLTRALFKRPVMTFSYGVTEGGVRTQIIEAYKEEFGLHEPHPLHVNYLAEMIITATKEMLRRPNDVMEYIRGLAELQAERNLPLKWMPPSGLPVINNRCYEPNTKTVELKLKGRRVEYRVADGRKDKINTADAMNDAPANFVHSMDAAHLALAVNAAVEEGITDIAVVHDCYGAAAPQVQRFQQIIRIQMALMYRCFDVLGRLRDGCGPLNIHALPETGKLDLLQIQRAEYTFT
jgi:Autographiviridae RNA polymerase